MAVSVEGLAFHYRNVPVLADVSFSLSPGVTVLLGPNGAGKSTLMKLLVGLLRPSSGEVHVPGRVGYLEQQFAVMGSLTVLRHVAYAAWAAGIPRDSCNVEAARVLERVGLTEKEGQRVRRLSGGQRQRLGLACAMVGSPDAVVLDEPTVGVDPAQRVEIRRYLKASTRESVALVSTHLVDDATHIADRVLILGEGHLAFDGSVEELEARAGGVAEAGVSLAESGYLHVLEGVRS